MSTVTLFVFALSVIVTDPLFVVVSLRQASAAVVSVQRESFRVFPSDAELLCVGVFGVFDAVQEAIDDLGAAEICFRLPGVVIRRPFLPADEEFPCSVLFRAHFDDFLDFVLVLAVTVAIPLFLFALVGQGAAAFLRGSLAASFAAA